MVGRENEGVEAGKPSGDVGDVADERNVESLRAPIEIGLEQALTGDAQAAGIASRGQQAQRVDHIVVALDRMEAPGHADGERPVGAGQGCRAEGACFSTREAASQWQLGQLCRNASCAAW